MSEEKERPDRATGPRELWERLSDGKLFVASWSTSSAHLHCASADLEGGGECMAVERMPVDRYRIRELPEEPWPPVPKVEKRRVVIIERNVTYFSPDYKWRPVAASLDEIRDCEIDENGSVKRVIPNEER